MHPFTHLLTSWTIADATALPVRDRRLLAWCGVLPDLDALGLIGDRAREWAGLDSRWWYGTWHHVLLHGLFGAIVLPLAALPLARQRWKLWAWGFLVVHVHLLADLVGSRGPEPDDIWPIHYLGPFSLDPELRWQGQWPLNAWPNVLLTAALLGWALVRAVRAGRTPAELAGRRVDEAVVTAVRDRWRSLRGGLFR